MSAPISKAGSAKGEAAKSAPFSSIRYAINRYRGLSVGYRRLVNFGLAAVMLILGTYLAFTQPPRPNPFEPVGSVWQQLWSPVERNAVQRLPRIIGDLNAVHALPGTNQLWAVGDGGLILHSVDGGDCWQQLYPVQGPGCDRPIGFGFSIISEASAEEAQPNYAQQKLPGDTPDYADPVQQTAPIQDVEQQQAQSAFGLETNLVSAPSLAAVTEDLTDIYFIDANRGWAVGGSGTILATADGGLNWTAQTSGGSEYLESVTFIDANRGWAVGESGTILATADGGLSWSGQTSGSSEWLDSVTFIDANHGWAVGGTGTIVATADGGASWSAETSGRSERLDSVTFIDANRGWAVGGSGTILATADGGASWSGQTSVSSEHLQSVTFIDANHGWAVGGTGTILATADGGASWSGQISASSARLMSVTFIDANRGWAVGESGTILATADGGASWAAQTSGSSGYLQSVTFVDANRGRAVGEDGTILSTADGGASWGGQTSGSSDSLQSVTFADADRGWAVGEDGTILSTADSGASWSGQISGSSEHLVSVTFVDADRGWAVGEDGTILSTADGGASWSGQTSGSSDSLQSVTFADANHGWAVGSSGTILATADGGLNWSAQTSGSSDSLQAVTFIDANRGWVVGSSGTILATADGGASWSGQTSGSSEHLQSVTFVDASRGWAAGSSGAILATADGGASWSGQTSGSSEHLQSVTFVDASRGWAVGFSGTVLATADGGQHWVDPRLPYRQLPAPWYYLLLLVSFGVALRPVKQVIKTDAKKGLEINIRGDTDRPVASRIDDKLNFWPVSLALSRFLRNRQTRPPLTVAITGSWGSGKSSLMNLLQEDLIRSGVQPVWFNAWHHESEEEHLLAALLQNIRQQGIPPLLRFDNGRFYGLRFRFSLIVNRFKGRPLLQGLLLALIFANVGYYYHHREFAFQPGAQERGEAAAVCLNDLYLPLAVCQRVGGPEWQPKPVKPEASTQKSTVAEAQKPLDLLALLINLVGGGGLVTLFSWLRAFGFSPAQLAREIGSSGNRQIEKRMDYRQRFQQEFSTVTDALSPRTMLILIDDLDRCQPKTVVQVLEAINFLTSAGSCYVVLGMARELVEPAVGLAFRDIADEISHFGKQATPNAEEPSEVVAGNRAVALQSMDGTPNESRESRNGYAKRREFAREYLEKLINLEIPVPTVEAAQALALVSDESANGEQMDALQLQQRRRRWATAVKRVIVLVLVAVTGFSLGWLPQPAVLPEIPKETATQPELSKSAATAALRAVEEEPKPVSAPAEKMALKGGAVTTYIPGQGSPMSPWASIGAVLLLILSGISLWLRHLVPPERPEPSVVEDTRAFSQALRAWNPVIAERLITPRRLRRFMNRLRYMAVRLNVLAEDPSFTGALGEDEVVILGALHLIHPDCLDLARACDSDAEFLQKFSAKTDWREGEQMPDRQAVAEISAAVSRCIDPKQPMRWQFDGPKIELYKLMLDGIRVH